MHTRLLFLITLFAAGYTPVHSQEVFSLRIDSMNIEGLPGLQSFAAASYDNKWILVGGRTDGLHMKQPFASFHPDYNNREIFVVDFSHNKTYTISITGLPLSIADQLQSANMEFLQQDSLLYVFGGYGYSKALGRFITHPRVTCLHLPRIIRAAMNNQSIAEAVSSTADERMAVTGGGAGIIGNRFILAGGQKFSGRYNPHGPDHGPGFTQLYTNEIRSFELITREDSMEIKNYSALHDTAHLHRRDYNFVPQIFADTVAGYTMFSGVFQYGDNIPWLTSVHITPGGYQHDAVFHQQYSHYHSAHVPLYSKKTKEMHTLFFGGIARFYTAHDSTREDKEIPFVKTISLVSRHHNGITRETVLPTSMPGLLGASAWFTPDNKMPLLKNGILRFDAIPAGEHLMGYIIGGIRSDAPNIFWPNSGKQSKASSAVYRVYITRY